MNRRTLVKTLPALTVLAGAASSFAQDKPAASQETSGAAQALQPVTDLQPIKLMKPQTDGGKTVLVSLWERKTIRSIKPEKLPPQMLSNLLWAAFGVNREKGPSGRTGRTAASASNSQEIDIYVAMPEGIYLYDGVAHCLNPIVAGDLRAKAGRGRGSGATAPVRLIYVVDMAKFARAPFQEPGLKDVEIQKMYYGVDCGLIAGNVYLFAASQGLAAWFHNCNKPDLTTTLKLRPDQRALFAQTVGYPV
ncbi:MAG: nitroreductase family protein [Candidatus Sumerlaeota bacterium]|nr:nitroreductase family protein [Candidatus Sumerlaeota bacterium]